MKLGNPEVTDHDGSRNVDFEFLLVSEDDSKVSRNVRSFVIKV